MGVAQGWWYSVRSAEGPDGSNTNNDEAVRGRLIFDYGWNKARDGWYDPWTIWVTPNYDGTTIIRPA